MTTNRNCCDPKFDFKKKPRSGKHKPHKYPGLPLGISPRKYERGIKGLALPGTKTMWRRDRKFRREVKLICARMLGD